MPAPMINTSASGGAAPCIRKHVMQLVARRRKRTVPFYVVDWCCSLFFRAVRILSGPAVIEASDEVWCTS
jgi:hypothetical protein